ncbi:hypothetical protein DYBT9275_06008 [Dyadobacter sp. CECT 9275]|uniref:TonB-dependent receptor n=1 Tax=Dyadobacter helix TaxID=2822344 RepID=A0A916NP34_9BACT|nr:outer membrane beta-barrel family protein [Dyadobacter sp. CECT 9275]CAG5018470.1 hypothetical protein DYBT9275_06008 [Dyadobacter sp. CECT 9275]
MKTYFFSLLFLSICFHLFAQSPTKLISGTVKDTKNEVLPGATVRLLKSADSVLVKGEITDVNGKFSFKDLENSTYLLSITSLGQKQFTSVPLVIDDMHPAISLPVIILLPAKNIELNEVVIKSKKPLIVQEIDKTVVNVEAMISSAASNTLEVMEKTPGVSVSSSGEVSLNGRGGVLVLIDGRSTYMSGQDLAAYLKSLPGGLLDKIELMDNPPARYDASGNAVINIRLKKNREGGLTGNVAMGVSMGKYARTNDALNLNYNFRKVNVFANLGYGYEKNYNLDHFDRRFYNGDAEPTSTVNLVNDQRTVSKGINVNLGLDFAATSKTTYGLILNLNDGERNGKFDYASTTPRPVNGLETTGSGNTVSTDQRTNTSMNLNMLHKFNPNGRELSADVNYLHYQSRGNQTLRNYIFQSGGTPDGQNTFLYAVPSGINIYTAKADYVHPLKNKASIDAGFKTSVIDNDIIFDYYKVTNNVPSLDNSQSNHFRYHENINAIYINGQKKWKRLGAQFGLRVENTQARGKQLGNAEVEGSSFTKNYTGLFPGIFVNYKLDDAGKNTLGLMAVRRISRPNYQLLNPFVFYKDQYSYSSGNPMLNPQYQHRIELKYQHKQFLNMGLSYNKFTHSIFQTTRVDGNVLTTRPDNLAGGFMVLLNTTVSASPVKWWYTNTTLRLSRIGLKGLVDNENLNFSTNIARLEVNNYFTISKNIGAELGGYYASRDLTGQTVTSDMYRVNASVQQRIWKGKGSIRLTFEDLFHSWIYHNKSIGLPQSEYWQTGESDTQRVGFAMTYRFGKDTFARKRKHTNNAMDEEKGRIE